MQTYQSGFRRVVLVVSSIEETELLGMQYIYARKKNERTEINLTKNKKST